MAQNRGAQDEYLLASAEDPWQGGRQVPTGRA